MGVLNAASVVIPNRVLAGVRVEGPDEDTFTLVVRAAKLLGRAEVTSGGPVGVPRRIHILSTLPEAWANLLRETGAFGTGQLVLEPLHSAAVHSTLESMLAQDPGEGARDWVIGARVSGESGTPGIPSPAGAVGLSFASGGGLGVSLLHTIRSPAEGRGDLTQELRRWLGHPPWDPKAGPSQVWWSGASLPTGSILSGTPSGNPGSPPPPPPLPVADVASPLRPLAVLVEGATELPTDASFGLWIDWGAHHLTVREVRRHGPVSVEGLPRRGDAPLPLEPAAWTARDKIPLQAVSEGAYVSDARYLESLPFRWRLEADKCGNCGRWTFPPRGRCPHCGETREIDHGRLPEMGGVLETYTVIRKGAQPSEFDFMERALGSYAVGLVRLPGGIRLTLQIADSDPATLAPGQVVELVLRRLYPQEGAWRYGLKAMVRRDLPLDESVFQPSPPPPPSAPAAPRRQRARSPRTARAAPEGAPAP